MLNLMNELFRCLIVYNRDSIISKEISELELVRVFYFSLNSIEKVMKSKGNSDFYQLKMYRK